jgi:NtrC-family two-component system response regulator AlgB
MKRGAVDYFCKPFNPEQVQLTTRKLAEVRALEQKVTALQEALGQANPEIELTSSNPVMQRELTLARQIAQSNATILIQGESGTGKGVLARAIHAWSPRAGKPFSVVSCVSLSAELLESELFGHVQGAFTGAVRDNPGRVALCEGGTLLLDEIGDMPLSLQPKLLRFVQDREYERVGDPRTRQADVRVIAATHQNLKVAVKEGRFREDLFYRLNVVQIEVPPLRRRPEDIKPLAEHLLMFFSQQNHRQISGFTDEALEVLQQYPWPGNVRELRNIVERAVILCQTERIGIQYLSPLLPPQTYAPGARELVSLDKMEEQYIRYVLSVTKSIEEAAQVLGMDRTALWRRRKKYGI